MESPLTVLHVDDDPDVLELSRTSFRRQAEDVETVVASSAAEGLDVLGSRSVDCVVSDSLRCPDDRPFVVAVREAAPSVPILLFTAKKWDDVAESAVEAGVAEYVRKAETGDVETVVRRARELAELSDVESLTSDSDSDTESPTLDSGALDGRTTAVTTDGVDGEWTTIATHDWVADDELGTTIAEALSSYTGVDATEAEPLFTTLDAEALETLLRRHSRTDARYDVRVRFPYRRWELLVTSGGDVAMRRLPATGDE
jgi:DNA-binding NarL/FixJ family response regulator